MLLLIKDRDNPILINAQDGGFREKLYPGVSGNVSDQLLADLKTAGAGVLALGAKE